MIRRLYGRIKQRYKAAFKKDIVEYLRQDTISNKEVNARLAIAKWLFGKELILAEIKDIKNICDQNVLCDSSQEVNIGQKINGKTPDSAHVSLPSLGYYEIKNIVANPDSPILFVKDKNELVRQFYPYPDQLNIRYTSGNIYGHNGKQHIADISYKRTIKKGILLTGSYSRNWYHWTHDILSRAALFADLPDKFKNYPLIVPNKCLQSKNHTKMIKLAFPNSLLLGINDNVLVKNSVFLDSPSINTPHKYHLISSYDTLHSGAKRVKLLRKYKNLVLENLKKSMSAEVTEKETLPHKVLLARKQHKRTYNQKEVIRALGHKGYKAIYFEDMSVDLQLLHMQSAKYIVGPTGAAWANLLFSNALAGLIWVPSCIQESTTYTKIAQVSNTDLRYMTFPTDAKSWPEFKKLKKPYNLDVSELLRQIDLMELANANLSNTQ